MTDLKALLDLTDAAAGPPPPVDTTATIARIHRHRHRRTAAIVATTGAVAAAVIVATTAGLHNRRADLPVAVDTPRQTTPSATVGTSGGCGKPVTVTETDQRIPLSMTLVSARVETSNGPWRIVVQVKVTNQSDKTLVGTTGRGPHTVAATKDLKFAFAAGGQFSSAHYVGLAPGQSATYSGAITLGDCDNAMDAAAKPDTQVFAQQEFSIDGETYTVYGGPWTINP
ncbi:hypothetical protein [Kribbella deserti]|uniref:DUF4352 domain-containing protein n=1 Tax=Kribbella deserti TaxID=1926257 RepID=A0ABV6QF46_9ACTN